MCQRCAQGKVRGRGAAWQTPTGSHQQLCGPPGVAGEQDIKTRRFLCHGMEGKPGCHSASPGLTTGDRVWHPAGGSDPRTSCKNLASLQAAPRTSHWRYHHHCHDLIPLQGRAVTVTGLSMRARVRRPVRARACDAQDTFRPVFTSSLACFGACSRHPLGDCECSRYDDSM